MEGLPVTREQSHEVRPKRLRRRFPWCGMTRWLRGCGRQLLAICQETFSNSRPRFCYPSHPVWRVPPPALLLQTPINGWAFLHTGQWQFVDFNRKMGLPAPVLVASLQTLNESIGALLLACGYLTRFAAASLAFGFAVATYCNLKAAEAAWMMAGYFCIMFTTLLLAGPGKFSIDYRLETKARAHSHDTVQK
jgi:uncharacterized membrane protein YphA (DoxX/SURF4 family)